jgi:hypothetical protein
MVYVLGAQTWNADFNWNWFRWSYGCHCCSVVSNQWWCFKQESVFCKIT